MGDSSERDWYQQASQYVEWLELNHPGLVEKQCGVPQSTILEALQAAAAGEKISEVPTADGDFVPSSRSELRVWATQAIPLTSNQLQRSLHEHQQRLGAVAGAQEFCLQHGLSDHGADPQEAIWNYLENANQEVFKAFALENRNYSPQYQKGQQPSPEPLTLPEGCRLKGKQKLSSAFTGTGSVDTAMEDTGHIQLVSFCEKAPYLVEHLKTVHPEAKVVKSLEEYLDPGLKRHAAHHDASPPCPAHATSNLYRRGNADKFCGQHFEEQGKYIEHLAPFSLY